MHHSLAGQHIGLGARPFEAQDRDKRRLAGFGVLADLLADLGLVALGVEQVVGDLEGEAEVVGVGVQGVPRALRSLAQDRSGLASESDELAGLEALQGVII